MAAVDRVPEERHEAVDKIAGRIVYITEFIQGLNTLLNDAQERRSMHARENVAPNRDVGKGRKEDLDNKVEDLRRQLEQERQDRELLHHHLDEAKQQLELQKQARIQAEKERDQLQHQLENLRAEVQRLKNVKRFSSQAFINKRLSEQLDSRIHRRGSFTEDAAAMKIQAVFRGCRLRRALSDLDKVFKGQMAGKKMLKRRNAVLWELLKTERTYVLQLQTVVKEFFAPLSRPTGPRLLTPDEVRQIFANVNMVLKVNETLLSDLEERMGEWPFAQLGKSMLNIAPFLKTYTDYVNNYNRALTTLTQAKKRRDFATFLKQKEARHCGGLDLVSYLITPVQRIPRYRLLLEDLVKNTPPEHGDFVNIVDSLEAIKQIADFVNERKREAENLMKVVEVKTNLIGYDKNLVEPHRHYVREGIVTHVKRLNIKERYLFLFNDILIVSIRSRSGYHCKEVIEMMDVNRVAMAPEQGATSHAFEIVCLGDERFLFAASSDEERDLWVQCIQECSDMTQRKESSRKEAGEVSARYLENPRPISRRSVSPRSLSPR
eukprot:TRINITY_DN38545_c0_g1_i1.p1 TRINITY_DN38545_c0_g1~~TRINITY_DN38545_c0_g1_i1.p1  ORF type:complete len:557 (-),score=134.50 TRINITY_DN38545_c0_g1_i1:67-1710(-)